MPERTILCALDNRDLVQIFEKALTGERYTLRTAHDGEEAHAIWVEDKPDLVILDVSLSKLDGFEVVEKARSDSADSAGHIPIILLSDSRISPHYQERADSLGVDLLLAKPVPLDQLLDCVSELIKPEACAKTASDVETERKASAKEQPRSSEPMAGSFSELPFPRLLHELHGLRANGVLMLTNGRKRKAIEFRQGMPVAIKSNMVHECLGNFLVRSGKISPEDQKESVVRTKRGEGLQGEILVAMELVDEETIALALRDQAREKLFEVFAWETGEFKLELRGKIKRANSLALNTSPANVILEGVLRYYPMESVDGFLAANRERLLASAANPFYRFQDVDLKDDEKALITELDSQPALEKYVTSSENIRRAIFGLVSIGLIELKDESGQAVEPLANCKVAPKIESSQRNRDEAVDRAELTELVNTIRNKNHFELLGIPRSSGDSALEASYEELAKRVHPDRYQSASRAIRELAAEVYDRVHEAYDTLCDPKRRQHYILEIQMGERKCQEDEAGKIVFAAETAFQKGTSLMERRAYEEALVHFGKALEGNDEDGEYHAYYGWCLYLCHPDASTIVEEAIEHVKRGAGLAPTHEKPFLFLGRLYKVMGKVKPAENMFTRAVQIQPECVEALRELRLINLRREKSKGLLGRLLGR